MSLEWQASLSFAPPKSQFPTMSVSALGVMIHASGENWSRLYHKLSLHSRGEQETHPYRSHYEGLGQG